MGLLAGEAACLLPDGGPGTRPRFLRDPGLAGQDRVPRQAVRLLPLQTSGWNCLPGLRAAGLGRRLGRNFNLAGSPSPLLVCPDAKRTQILDPDETSCYLIWPIGSKPPPRKFIWCRR